MIVDLIDRKELMEAKNLKYLGAWIASSDKDSAVQKVLADNKLSKLMNNRHFILTLETVLLYETEICIVSHSFLQPSSPKSKSSSQGRTSFKTSFHLDTSTTA